MARTFEFPAIHHQQGAQVRHKVLRSDELGRADTASCTLHGGGIPRSRRVGAERSDRVAADERFSVSRIPTVHGQLVQLSQAVSSSGRQVYVCVWNSEPEASRTAKEVAGDQAEEEPVGVAIAKVTSCLYVV